MSHSSNAGQSSTGFNSLPCEALAIIASHLDEPERRCLSQACQAGFQAVAISTLAVVLPGTQVLGFYTASDDDREDSTHTCSTGNPTASTQCPTPTGGYSTGHATTRTPGAAAWRAWLKHYMGLRSLKVTACDSCRLSKCANSISQLPVLLDPTQPTHRHQHHMLLGGCSSASLGDFLISTGNALPHLRCLDLGSICPCLLSHGVKARGGSSSSSSSSSSNILAAIAGSCPNLVMLSIPGWLLHCRSSTTATSSSSGHSSPGMAAAAPASDAALGRDGAVLLHERLQEQLCSPQTVQEASSCAEAPDEHLSSLSSLAHLTTLRIQGLAGLPHSLSELRCLRQLRNLSLAAGGCWFFAPGAAASYRRRRRRHNGSSSSSGISSSVACPFSSPFSSYLTGRELGDSLARLPGLTSLTLTGTMEASGTLQSLSGFSSLCNLHSLELLDLTDFAVESMTSLAGLTGLTYLAIQRCSALKATARTAMPSELWHLQQLAVLVLDCDLHLRDMQVLSQLSCLTALHAASFHQCIHLAGGLCLPSLRKLYLTSFRSFLPQMQQPQQPVQFALQPANLAVQHPPAYVPAAAVAAATAVVVPAAAAAAAVAPAAVTPTVVTPAAVAPAAGSVAGAGGPMPHAMLSWPAELADAPASLVQQMQSLMLQQPQHQQQQLLPEPALHDLQRQLLVQLQQRRLQLQRQQLQAQLTRQLQQLQQAQQQHQQPQMGYAVLLSPLSQQQQLLLPLQAHVLQPQALGGPGAGYAAQAPPQQSQQAQQQPLMVLVVRQVQQAPAAAAAATAAAAVVPPAVLPVFAAVAGNNAAAAPAPATHVAVPVCWQPRGWLALTFPQLTEFVLDHAEDCPTAFAAIQGHQSLRKLVLGLPSCFKRGQQHQQQQDPGLLMAPEVSTPPAAAAAAAEGSVSVAAIQPHAFRVFAEPSTWGLLSTVPHLEALGLQHAGALLGSNPLVLRSICGHLTQLVLLQASCLTDKKVAALMGSVKWSKLQHLSIEGAEGLSDMGLGYLSKLPRLTSLNLTTCNRITASGLASLILASSSIQHVQLLCCAGVSAAEAETVQSAVWSVSRRHVQVRWSRQPRKVLH